MFSSTIPRPLVPTRRQVRGDARRLARCADSGCILSRALLCDAFLGSFARSLLRQLSHSDRSAPAHGCFSTSTGHANAGLSGNGPTLRCHARCSRKKTAISSKAGSVAVKRAGERTIRTAVVKKAYEKF